MIATARAHANIALVKYWGKRDADLILPCNGSLSMTLDGLYTTTTVEFKPELCADEVTLDDRVLEGQALQRVTEFLELVRGLAGKQLFARVTSINDVPTAAGLASSASGFAALAAAAARAICLDLGPTDLSILARRGSGSACRSIFEGYVEWRRGRQPDGRDSHGVAIAPAAHWDLRMLVTIVEASAKAVSSRGGMDRTVRTSAFYPGWLATADTDLTRARRAVLARDFEALGTVMESNALKMHGTMLAARPPFTYWTPATLEIMHAVWALRAAGTPAYFTMDAGPNVKVLCQPQDAVAIAAALAALPGVTRVVACAPGPGVAIRESIVQ